jgi:hypothetical protein
MTPPLFSGLELARALYAEVVAPLLADEPGRPRYAAPPPPPRPASPADTRILLASSGRPVQERAFMKARA